MLRASMRGCQHIRQAESGRPAIVERRQRLIAENQRMAADCRRVIAGVNCGRSLPTIPEPSEGVLSCALPLRGSGKQASRSVDTMRETVGLTRDLCGIIQRTSYDTLGAQCRDRVKQAIKDGIAV